MSTDNINNPTKKINKYTREYVNNIINFNRPKTKQEATAFIDLCTPFSDQIEEWSRMEDAIQSVIPEGSIFSWTRAREEEFQSMKKLIKIEYKEHKQLKNSVSCEKNNNNALVDGMNDDKDVEADNFSENTDDRNFIASDNEVEYEIDAEESENEKLNHKRLRKKKVIDEIEEHKDLIRAYSKADSDEDQADVYDLLLTSAAERSKQEKEQAKIKAANKQMKLTATVPANNNDSDSDMPLVVGESKSQSLAIPFIRVNDLLDRCTVKKSTFDDANKIKFTSEKEFMMMMDDDDELAAATMIGQQQQPQPTTTQKIDQIQALIADSGEEELQDASEEEQDDIDDDDGDQISEIAEDDDDDDENIKNGNNNKRKKNATKSSSKKVKEESDPNACRLYKLGEKFIYQSKQYEVTFATSVETPTIFNEEKQCYEINWAKVTPVHFNTCFGPPVGRKDELDYNTFLFSTKLPPRMPGVKYATVIQKRKADGTGKTAQEIKADLEAAERYKNVYTNKKDGSKRLVVPMNYYRTRNNRNATRNPTKAAAKSPNITPATIKTKVPERDPLKDITNIKPAQYDDRQVKLAETLLKYYTIDLAEKSETSFTSQFKQYLDTLNADGIKKCLNEPIQRWHQANIISEQENNQVSLYKAWGKDLIAKENGKTILNEITFNVPMLNTNIMNLVRKRLQTIKNNTH